MADVDRPRLADPMDAVILGEEVCLPRDANPMLV